MSLQPAQLLATTECGSRKLDLRWLMPKLARFEEGHVPGFLGLAEMELELGAMGRKVDLRTPGELSRYVRDDVISSAAGHR